MGSFGAINASGGKSYAFRRYVNSLYGKNDSKDHSINSSHIKEGSAGISTTLGKRLLALRSDAEQGVYNTNITSAFTMDYKDSDQKTIMKDLIGNATIAKFDKKTGTWKSTGKRFEGSKKKEIEQVTQIGYGGGILYEIMYTNGSTEMLTTDQNFKSSPRGNAVKAFGPIFDNTLKELKSHIIEYNRSIPAGQKIRLLTKEELMSNPELLVQLDSRAKEFRNAGLNYMRGMHVPAAALSKDFEDLAKGLGVTAGVEDEQ